LPTGWRRAGASSFSCLELGRIGLLRRVRVGRAMPEHSRGTQERVD